jgi:hypothetical protein
METFIKEKEIVHDDYNNGGWNGNLRSRANAGLTLGIIGTAGAALALARQGGIGGLLGGVASAPASGGAVTYNVTSPACCTSSLYTKECEDILNVTKGMYDLAIAGMTNAAKAREVDVAEKFGLYVNNRDNIDRVNGRINDELFSLYKYTRDKDDETNAKIYDIAQQVAINTAVRPYQDKLIQCKIDESVAWLKNYVDRNLCGVIKGVNCLPLTPTVTGVIGQNCCYQFPAAAAAGAAEAGA